MTAVFLASLLVREQQIPPVIVPKAKLVVNRTSRIRAGAFRIVSNGVEPKDAAIVIRGNGITVDFAGATIAGAMATVEPDERAGLGVYAEGKNITIKNAKIRGYKVGLMARNAPGLRILDSDFSYNWKQHLMSTPEREDLSDWMSYHQNEKDEWLRYGAGIYLRKCDSFEVKGCRVNGGQNALMMTECDKGKVWNNNFSFNSSLGIGMYRSSENRVMHNKVDWCVRGFSYGKYNRGQDSAGILVYEQSNRNVFAYNSVTHGGDGFFLWAGQTTMDTGKGGCNENLLYGNDFSHAPTNGIEATFSRNAFVNNLIVECWHGIWGGYSFESKVVGNVFGFNEEGIAWEHGQDNLISHNHFGGDNESIVIWSNPTQDPNWGYPKNRDTRSRNWTITNNVFIDAFKHVFRVRRTQDIIISRNVVFSNGRVFSNDPSDPTQEITSLKASENEIFARVEEPVVKGQVNLLGDDERRFPNGSALSHDRKSPRGEYLKKFDVSWDYSTDPRALARKQNRGAEEDRLAACAPFYVSPLVGGMKAMLPKDALRGWRYMFVDEWGPYDFKRPILVLRNEDADGTRTFELLGPPGSAKLVGRIGVSLTSISADGVAWRTPDAEIRSVQVPSFLRAKPIASKGGNALLAFEYRGERITDYRGAEISKGQPYRFEWRVFDAPIDWSIRWHRWDPKSVPDPKSKMPAVGSILSRTELREPVAETKATKLDFVSGGSPFKGVPNDHFITLAEGSFEIEAGRYEIAVTADDGIRLWLDDLLIVDEWHWQGPTRYTKTVALGGKHRLRVEHYEIDGYTALKLEVAPKR